MAREAAIRRLQVLRRTCFGAAWAGIAVLSLIATAAPAWSDAAAGREAYEKGDYKRAMAEWQAAADHDDPDAQFGLGSLYELGTGDLKQSYKQADYWYRKAARQGNREAQYRLALIWAVGSDDFPADLAEAYKWVLLAVESPGVWGSLAADLKTQLDKVTTADERLDAQKRAAAWKKEEAPVAVVGPVTPPQPQGPGSKGGGSGCPGWPFPTLPCTEQFPALPGLQPPSSPPTLQRPPANAPVDDLNAALAQIDCASLHSEISAEGSPSISGTVPDLEQKAKLVHIVARLFPDKRPQMNVDVVPPPLCRSLAEFRAMGTAGLVKEVGLGLRLNNGSLRLRQGDPIKLEVRGPPYPVNLRIDYYSLDGQVAHLKPEDGEPPPKIAGGTTHVFGNPANGENWKAGGAPFGTELITVLATPGPLDLGDERAKVEMATDYLRDLQRSLERISVSLGQPAIMATLLVRTSP
jgi:Sel1 repeat